MRLILGVVLIAATTARAQDSVVRACGQAANGKIPAAFYGRINAMPAKDTEKVGSAYMADLLEAVRESLHPGNVGLRAYMVDPGLAVLAGEATVVFSVTREGKILDVALASSSLSPEFDHAIYDAVRAADTLGLPTMRAGAPSRVRFSLTMYTTVPYPPTVAIATHEPGVTRPLVQTTLAEWMGQSTTEPMPLSKDGPTYPEVAREVGAEDSLLIRFVIDTSGRIVPSTVFFEAGTYQNFARSVQMWVPRARFTPARIGACAVPVLTRQSYIYKLQRSGSPTP